MTNPARQAAEEIQALAYCAELVDGVTVEGIVQAAIDEAMEEAVEKIEWDTILLQAATNTMDQLTRERDEAREAARYYYSRREYHFISPEHEARWPWINRLKESP